MILFLVSYEMIYQISSDKHEGMLVELNNALSHILSYLMDKDKNIANLDKANDHLLRGALDGLKAIVVLKRDKIIFNDSLLKDLIKLRKQEALNIGKLSKSGIVKNTLNLSKVCEN